VGEIDFRVQSVRKTKDGAVAEILAYKSARTDMNRLDEAFGVMGWTNKFDRDSKGVLQCSIGAIMENGFVVWKTSNGTESNIEREKGEYSDAMKRAGFMFGIGRELYKLPRIQIHLNQNDYYESGGKVKASPWFNPNNHDNWRWYIYKDAKKVEAKRNYQGNWKTVFDSNPNFKGEATDDLVSKMMEYASQDSGAVREKMMNYALTEDQERKIINEMKS